MAVSTPAIRAVFDDETGGYFAAEDSDKITRFIERAREHADEGALGSAKYTEAVASLAAENLAVSLDTPVSGVYVVREKTSQAEYGFSREAVKGGWKTKWGVRYQQILDSVYVAFEVI